jgi:cobalamin biosynthesis Mg chelatase CobN
LNELLNTTDELEATKNEGVTLEQAIYADETPEPETPGPEAYEPETTEPESTEPETSADGQSGPTPHIFILVAVVLVIGAAVTGVIIYRRKRKA